MVRNLTRRLFLRGAAVAAPLAAIPAVAAVAESYAEENPALLDLEGPLDAAIDEHQASETAYSEAYQVAKQLWPRAPEAIQGGCTLERNFLGNGYGDDILIHTADHFRWEAARHRRWRKMTPEREEEKRRTLELLPIAEEYEASCARALEVSQVREARERVASAVTELGRVANAIHAQPARTIAGVRFKAKVLAAWGRVGRYDRMLIAWKLDGEDWGAGLAASILEVLEV